MGHLALQFAEAVELGFLAEERDEFDFDGLAVKIAAEIEEVRFEQRFRQRTDCGVHANAGDTWQQRIVAKVLGKMGGGGGGSA